MLISDEPLLSRYPDSGFTVICTGSLKFKMYIAEHVKRQVSNIKRAHHRYVLFLIKLRWLKKMRLYIKRNDLLAVKLEIELSHIESHLAEESEGKILLAEKLENQQRKPDVEPKIKP